MIVNGGFILWINWIECFEFCGGGVILRICSCINFMLMYGGKFCFEKFVEIKECNVEFCFELKSEYR